MRKLIVLASILVPSIALAQPGYGPPPPGPAPAYAYNPQESWAFHRGLTFEANLGIGYIHASVSGNGVSGNDNSDAALGGLDLGLGGWVSPRLAISARIAGVTYSDGGTITQAFFGPSAQYWFTDQFWAGGGIGFSVLAGADENGNNSDSIRGWGLDVRAGYTFNKGTPHTFNVSVELNPGFYSQDGFDYTFTGVALLAGYQFL